MGKPIICMSTDSNAPVLNGVAGSLVAVLDACLVNGYNQRNVTALSVSAGVGSLTTDVAHNFVLRDNLFVKISGATPAEMNGIWEVTAVPGSNTLTLSMPGVTDGSATGTVTVCYAPLGWSKEFSGTNKAVYRPAVGNRFFYRVQHDASVTEGANWARLMGYEVVSSVDSGQGPFPASGYLLAYLSSAAGTTARPWVLIGDGAGVYFIPYPKNTTILAASESQPIYMGDGISDILDDTWMGLVAGLDVSTNRRNGVIGFKCYYYNQNLQAIAVARPYTGQTGSVYMQPMPGQFGNLIYNNSTETFIIFGYDGLPHPYNGQTIYTRPSLSDVNWNAYRGYFPGLYYPYHNKPLTNLTNLVDGSRILKAFLTFNYYTGFVNGPNGQIFIDIGAGFRP